MIPYSTEINIFKSLFKKGNYTKFKKNSTVKSILEKYNIKFKIARAIISNYITNHIIKQHHIINNKLKQLHITDDNLLEISTKIDFPPYQLLKLCEKRFGKKFKTETL